MRATALLSAVICGSTLLTVVPAAFAQTDPETMLVQLCHRGQTILVPSTAVARRLARGDSPGACSPTPVQNP